MRVLMLRNLGIRDYGPKAPKKGQIVTVSQEEGELLIKRGLAEEAKAKPQIAKAKTQPQIKGVPPKSEAQADEAGTSKEF